MPDLKGKKVAILLTDGFEQVEMTEPRKALEEAGAKCVLIAPKAGEVQGFRHHDKQDRFRVDQTLDASSVSDFDAVLLPGGVINADALRVEKKAQQFVQEADRAGKPIAVICHGAWLLVSAGLAKGRTLTSWPTLQDDLRNAGAQWKDEEVIRDGNWVSSRKPDDLPAFNREITRLFSERNAARREQAAESSDSVRARA